MDQKSGGQNSRGARLKNLEKNDSGSAPCAQQSQTERTTYSKKRPGGRFRHNGDGIGSDGNVVSSESRIVRFGCLAVIRRVAVEAGRKDGVSARRRRWVDQDSEGGDKIIGVGGLGGA